MSVGDIYNIYHLNKIFIQVNILNFKHRNTKYKKNNENY